jgi:hypothetical protein
VATLKEVLDVLGPVYRVPERALLTVFKGRIQNFQRLGIPFNARPGKGARVDYSRDDVLQLAFACELSELGFMPGHVEVAIRMFWPQKIGPVFAKEWENPSSPDEPMRLFVITKVMTCQWQTPVRMRVAGAENYVEQSQPFEEIKPIKCKGDGWDIVLSMMDQKQGYHFTAFNVTKLVASIKARFK